MMNVMNTNLNTAASRQARFSFAGFFGYAYFYFFGMDNSRACMGQSGLPSK